MTTDRPDDARTGLEDELQEGYAGARQESRERRRELNAADLELGRLLTGSPT